MKKTVFLSLCFIVLCSNGYAASGAEAFLRDGVGAEETAMGGADTAGSEGVNSVYWNPAGLTRMQSYIWQFSTMYDFMTCDRHYAYIGVAKRTDDTGNFGFSIINYGVSNIEILDDAGLYENTEDNMQFVAGITYANKINYQVRYGLTLKGHYQDLVNYKATGYSVDAGAIFQPLLDQEIYFGIMLQNILGQMFWDNYNEDMMSAYKAGASVKFFDEIIKLNVDVVKEESSADLILRAGVEFRIVEYLLLRAGIDEKYPSAGIGIRYEGYKVDYAYVYNKYGLGDAHQLSLILMW